MAVDIYHSRRTHFKLCSYWTRYEKGDPSVYSLNNKPDGFFWAVEINTKELKNNIISNGFLFDSENITLKTTDEVDIKNNNLVQYLGHIWCVVAVSRELHLKESEFGKADYTTYINLRR